MQSHLLSPEFRLALAPAEWLLCEACRSRMQDLKYFSQAAAFHRLHWILFYFLEELLWSQLWLTDREVLCPRSKENVVVKINQCVPLLEGNLPTCGSDLLGTHSGLKENGLCRGQR